MDSSSDVGSVRSTTRFGLSKVFAGRRHRKSDSLTAPPLVPGIEDDAGGLRSSIDEALGKLRDKARSSSDSRRDSIDSPNRLSSLLRRARRHDEEAEAANSLEYELSHHGSEESLNLALHKSVASSLLTEDESEEPPVRPSLSPHQSHAGYLTLSSPLIASEAVDSTSSSLPTISDTEQSIDDTLAPKHASTLAEPQPSKRRGSSPARKLKDTFGTAKKPSTSKSATEHTKSASTGSGGGLGSLFSTGKRSRGSSKVDLVEEAPLESGEGPQASLKRTEAPDHIDTGRKPPTAPELGHGPTTILTPPTPTDANPNYFARPATAASASKADHKPSPSDPKVILAPSGNIVSRRARSSTNPPSRLSNSILAPLTPTVEETKTPGGTLTSPTTGFFSSVFSAAQNAATHLGSTITYPSQRNRSVTAPEIGTENTGAAGGEEVIGGASDTSEPEQPGSPEKKLAIETLGSGDLSLSQLGIAETGSENKDMASNAEMVGSRPLTPIISYADEASARAEDSAAAKAVSDAYLRGPAEGALNGERSRSLSAVSDSQAQPGPSGDLPETRVKRSGSMRSRLSGGRTRRHRGSSATTGTGVGPPLSHSTTTLTAGRTATGFAVASAKRNRDFHQQFRSVPEDDYLIDDYSAALQRDILLHGRLYVSEGHICFSSNILGWVTNLVISFDEVVTIEKKSTAVIFPNAIVIQTLHARNVFASLVSRDNTYDLLIGIWKISHPNLKSSLNGIILDPGAGNGDKTEKGEAPEVIEDGSEEGSEDEVYDEDDDEEAAASFEEPGEGSVAGSEVNAETQGGKSVSRKPSAVTVGQPANGGPVKDAGAAEAPAPGAPDAQDFPGPASHGETQCGDDGDHFPIVLMDTTIPAPLGKVYSMMFGPQSGTWMRKWLIDDQKSQDLQMEDDKQGLGESKKQFNYSFIKPLNAPIGPKQTKCIVTQTLDQFDLEKAVTVTCSTQNPDVPSGNIFLVKTKYCLMWGPGNSTRMVMNCTIEWSGKSWLKGPIEKGTNEGQLAYAKDLVAALRGAVSQKAGPSGGKPGKKGKKGRKKAESESPNGASTPAAAAPAEAKAADWGLLEPLHGILGPITDMLPGFINAQLVIVVLVLMVLIMSFRSPSKAKTPYGGLGVPGLATPQRVIAYEEMWRREESELWDWLEERVRMDRTSGMGMPAAPTVRKQDVRRMGEKLGDERMSQRQMEDAIRVTQERLEVLKQAVERKGPMKGDRMQSTPEGEELQQPLAEENTADAAAATESVKEV
ncbi:uncharacterized protein K452DRAFT_306793 [Aplosporella prunicola CBS 121167]|uniref:VASt domain-containing protein n=1 Tax=Aplosporella prunicola CBS 121167 TaxID=1176127 RepID=A0A6A6BLM7_9PEZI|nr:uncharacterized protein K452DRAFT_306793 [Aplosporella prunicola CBS 121167]KAF2144184.1 hypothetical protein K452DRAFT_306793 [Aplosporella prunicola CBS 121167]